MLRERGVELRGDARSCAFIDATPASDDDWDAEFLDLILAVRVVDSLDDAIAHIRRHCGFDHTESSRPRMKAAAARFVHALRSAVVMVNASSRFSDGGELGLGAEIGISTTRLHAYGPMGAESLTIERFVVRGKGQQTRSLRHKGERNFSPRLVHQQNLCSLPFASRRGGCASRRVSGGISFSAGNKPVACMRISINLVLRVRVTASFELPNAHPLGKTFLYDDTQLSLEQVTHELFGIHEL